MEMKERLRELKDDTYGDFQCKLTPGMRREKIIGVRVPALRKLAKECMGSSEAETFLLKLPHEYYDENMLHSILLSEIRDYGNCMEKVKAFLPYIDNWAVCDTLSPKVFGTQKKQLLEEIRIWVRSKETYTCRFGIGMLMRHFLEEDFKAEYLEIVASVVSDEYYVNMMIAWYFATALSKQWTDTIRILEEKRLSPWVHNKTIQKAIESYRITEEEKAYLRTLRRKTKKCVSVYVASAFSKDGEGGNRAGIVLDHPELTEKQKMQISAELGYSETAFVTESDKAEYKIEYFTPTEEVPLCGHATIATFSALFLLGKIRPGKCRIETKAGILEVEAGADGLIMMQQNAPVYYDLLSKEELKKSMGEELPAEEADTESMPIQIISTGLKDIMYPVVSMEKLESLQVDMDALSSLSREKEVVGVHAFTLGGKEKGVDATCRNFAPLYGIPEESATGTASCALASYLYRYGRKKKEYVFEQGYSMGLPSRIIVRTEGEETIRNIFVGGYGYMAEEREIVL